MKTLASPASEFDASVDDCDDRSRPLIPDPYCLMTDGYRSLAGADETRTLYHLGMNVYLLRFGEAPPLEAKDMI